MAVKLSGRFLLSFVHVRLFPLGHLKRYNSKDLFSIYPHLSVKAGGHALISHFSSWVKNELQELQEQRSTQCKGPNSLQQSKCVLSVLEFKVAVQDRLPSGALCLNLFSTLTQF